jgi:N-glycosylase/DNA lyase
MILIGASDYDLSATFECGQAFRFTPCAEKTYRGVYKGVVLTFSHTLDGLKVDQMGGALSESDIRSFLDVDRDYVSMQQGLIAIEPKLEEAICLGSGIRLLNQEPFETLVSFILSSNSNMKRIQTHIEKLSELYGHYIGEINGKHFYAFPTHGQLLGVPLADFRQIGLGYRADYLYELMHSLEGEEALVALYDLETEALIHKLMCFKGIGLKVASCIALFGFGRHDAFPIDVWIKRYFERELGRETWNIKQMEIYGRNTYGPAAGVAQQYMFFWMLKKYKSVSL